VRIWQDLRLWNSMSENFALSIDPESENRCSRGDC
jgi:hypothetical protein